MARNGLDERDAAEQPGERFPFIGGERVLLFAGDHAAAHGDGRVGDGGKVVAAGAQQVLVEVERQARGNRHHGLAGKRLARRRQHVCHHIGLHGHDDQVACLGDLGGGVHGVRSQRLAACLQLVEVRGAGGDAAAIEAGVFHQPLRHGLCHVAEPDEPDACGACVHCVSFAVLLPLSAICVADDFTSSPCPACDEARMWRRGCAVRLSAQRPGDALCHTQGRFLEVVAGVLLEEGGHASGFEQLDDIASALRHVAQKPAGRACLLAAKREICAGGLACELVRSGIAGEIRVPQRPRCARNAPERRAVEGCPCGEQPRK